MAKQAKSPSVIREISWQAKDREPCGPNEYEVVLETSEGEVHTRYHPAADDELGCHDGVVWVGGAGGGFDGPAQGLYPAACSILQGNHISGLRVHYRFPNHFQDCVVDTLIGIEFLRSESARHLALVGHSFGGAVVIMAGAVCDAVNAVVSMSTQTYGTELAATLSPKTVLLLHGTADEIVPDACSREVFHRLREPRELKLFAGATHGLDEVREEVLRLLTRWIPDRFSELS